MREISTLILGLLIALLISCGGPDYDMQVAFSGKSIKTSQLAHDIENETIQFSTATEAIPQFNEYYAPEDTKDLPAEPYDGVIHIDPPCIFLYRSLTQATLSDPSFAESTWHRATLRMPTNLSQYEPSANLLTVNNQDPVSDGSYVRVWATIYHDSPEKATLEVDPECRAIQYLNVETVKNLEPLTNVVQIKTDPQFHGYYAAWGNDSIADSYEGTIRINPPCIYLYEGLLTESLADSSIRDSLLYRAALRMPINLLRYNPSANTIAIDGDGPVIENSYVLIWATEYSDPSQREILEIHEECEASKYLTLEGIRNIEPLDGIVSVTAPKDSRPDLNFVYSDSTSIEPDADKAYTPYPSTALVATLNTNYQEVDTLEAMTNLSDLVFVGKIIGYKDRLRESPTMYPHPDPGVGSPRMSYPLRVDIYDGIIFEIEEVIVGKLLPEQNHATLIIQSLILNRRSYFTYRVLEPSWEVIESGVAALLRPEGQRYLVYATDSRRSDPPYFFPGHYVFATQGGVAPLLEDGRIGTAASGPLADPDHGLTLEDVRAAVAEVTEN